MPQASYFICFCLDMRERDGSPQFPVRVKLKAGTDQGAKDAFGIWKETNPKDYNGNPFSERPRLMKEEILAE